MSSANYNEHHLSSGHMIGDYGGGRNYDEEKAPLIQSGAHGHGHGEDGKPPRVLSFISLLAIAYFCVSGGPYGIEGTVAVAPPAYVLLFTFLLPFFWSLPLGMITAELSNLGSGEDGGCSLWAEKAFGGEMSVLLGFFSWVANTVDLSLYPVLFVQYLSNAFDGTRYENDTWGGNLENCSNCSWFLAFLVIVVVVLSNLWGAENVGIVSNVLAVILLAPFVIMVGMGIDKVNLGFIFNAQGGFSAWRDVDLGTLIATIVWSFSGFDAIGQLAGEVKNPAKNYPLGVITVLIITIVTYLLPLLVGIQASQDWVNWQDGQFSSIAMQIGGLWLGVFMSIGGMASSLGLFNCNLCTVSRNLYSMSVRGYLPKQLSKLLPRRGTPFVSILLTAFFVGVLVMLPFNSILSLDMTMYSLVVILECIIYIKMYIFNPDIPRPYRAFKNRPSLIIVCMPIVVACVLIYTTPSTTKWHSSIAVAIGLILMAVTYIMRKRRERNQLSIADINNHSDSSPTSAFSINAASTADETSPFINKSTNTQNNQNNNGNSSSSFFNRNRTVGNDGEGVDQY
ncbi:hypothetical protein DFA_08631 [Cavenderia fasciculata]|uniref:Amino acid/polyamine transporter I n=1 Tax=Cavenderia fasciculata TaxID=261658 RepID=F4Q3C5_CACFS|nr:uncharacterized protein DFA_08631 [Cavenderia fasciculata]EGG17635.1 hypothetical protein DFA_08631 [Cavenderia fasciculata]|eukprot:XP_004356119.1 hypothetical protein DFA_08631 [Cavenderia fasciculata]